MLNFLRRGTVQLTPPRVIFDLVQQLRVVCGRVGRIAIRLPHVDVLLGLAGHQHPQGVDVEGGGQLELFSMCLHLFVRAPDLSECSGELLVPRPEKRLVSIYGSEVLDDLVLHDAPRMLDLLSYHSHSQRTC